MKTEDRENIGTLYEEGVWDRTKAGFAGLKGGLGGMKILGGQGYAKEAQKAKSDSLLKSFIQKMKNDLEVFEKDSLQFRGDRASTQITKKIADIKAALARFG